MLTTYRSIRRRSGSDRDGEWVAALSLLIATAKRNDISPQLRLADVLARIADHPASGLDKLPLWN